MNPYDVIANDLQQMRLAAGDIPYAEIVRRIAKLREQRGVEPAALRPARTTVYDAFRTGRTRVNAQLVGEIARAMGATEIEVSRWEERCVAARSQHLKEHENQATTESTTGLEQEVLPGQEPRKSASRAAKATLMVSCLALNLLGFWLVPTLGLPLYLDMIGTALTAFVLGPWAAVGVGLATNVAGLAITDSSSLAFAAVNVVGALVWGFGAKRLRRFPTIPKYLLLNVLVATACTGVATILLVFFFNGGTGHASEATTRNLSASGLSLMWAVLESNLLHSLADKLLTGFLVLAALGSVQRWITVPLYEDLAADSASRLNRLVRVWPWLPRRLYESAVRYCRRNPTHP